MKAKTIRNILKKVHKDFINLFSKEVGELVEKDAFITGGCITSMLLDEEVNDYDYYFKNSESLVKVLKEILESDSDNGTGDYSDDFLPFGDNSTNKKPEIKIEQFDDRVNIQCNIEKSNYVYFEGKKILITNNAVTIFGKKDEPTIQLVTRFVGSPDAIHTNYDFEHTKCYYDPEEDYLHLPQKSLESIITKELKYTGSKYPLASIIRTRKFINRGWSINAGQYLKMAIQLNDLDLRARDTLRDQLVGVDMTYFLAIIHEIDKKIKEDENFKLNTDWVMNLIDEKFDEAWGEWVNKRGILF